MNVLIRLRRRLVLYATLVGAAGSAFFVPLQAATLHVSQDSLTPSPPFASWETAARVLQDAVDAAQPGDTVLVTNGVYATGGRIVNGQLMNRLAIPARVVVQSVDGPETTVIEGAPRSGAPGGKDNGNGDDAVRCVHLGREAVLVGFTLRNGHTRTNGHYEWDQSGGGAWCDAQAQVVKCVLTNNAAHHMGGGSFRGDISQSRIVSNRARYGGGVCLANVDDSFLTGNAAENGGGAYMSRIARSTVSTNSANIGGGAMGGSLSDSLIRRNSAGQWGGGISQASLQKCRILDNTAERGGGAFLSTLFGCVLTGNTADLGGGAAGGTLRHCTITGNTAGSGGGTYLGTVSHSIVYFNDATLGANHEGSTFASSCTTPEPDSGTGNISSDPRLASSSRVSADSPTRAPESGPVERPTDLDDEPWQDPAQMGADQYIPGQATGVMTADIAGGAPTVAVRHALLWRADIEGRISSSRWDFGDGRTVVNQAFVRHSWDQPGIYTVTLTAFNDSQPAGISTSITVNVVEQPIHYVTPSPVRPTPPFASWDTAAPSIQSAIDAAIIPGSLVLVTNGIYRRGGASLPGDVLANRVALTSPVIVQSVGGPTRTLIVGEGPLSDFAMRAAFVGRDAVLSGFTLTNGHTRTLGARPREQRGGGVACDALGLVTNCVITGNLARQSGAGAYRGTLRNCTLVANHSLDSGGGAYECIVEDSTVDRNKANTSGGGASRSLLTRSLITGNAAPVGAGAYFGTLDFCRLDGNVTEGDGYGGGANGSTLRDCIFTNNVAYVGGGAFASSLLRCRVEGNEARRDGGGVSDSTLTECVVTGNTATYGGGSSESFLFRCELTRNEASVAAGAADGGELELCTVSDNAAFYGGATQHATLTRCVVRRNTAVFGGAGYRDLHFNSLLTENVATNQGGATFQSQLFHCTVTGNAAEAGGGTFEGTNRNCIVYYNTALLGTDVQGSLLATSCTSPSPALLPGNVTNAPAFLQPASGDFRLRADSPCIDAGANLTHLVGEDLDGRPRPIDGNVDGSPQSDLGAYEYDPDASDSNGDGIPDSWCLRYGLDPFDPALASGNPDQDAHSTFDEWVAGTNPTDPASAFLLTSVSNLPPVTVYVPSLTGRLYTLLLRTNATVGDALTEDWIPVPDQTGIPGDGSLLALRDTAGGDARYYRVEVRLSDLPAPATTSAHTFRRVRLAHVGGLAALDPIPMIASGADASATFNSSPSFYGEPLLAHAPPSNSKRAGVPWPSGDLIPGTSEADASPAPRRASLHATVKPPPLSHKFRIHTESSIPISPMLRGQEPFMLYAHSARVPTLEWGRGATYRGVAGGTDAETYDWKNLTSSTRPHFWSLHVNDPPVVTTLEWLKEARDYGAELVLTVNTRGRGHTLLDPQGRRLWTIDPASNGPDYLAQLAADWVRYANLIAPRYRLTPDRQLPPDLAAIDPEADRLLQELKSLGNGTNAWRFRLATEAAPDVESDPPLERPLLLDADDPAPTPKVTYWEIGNEVETPMNHTDPRGTRFIEPGINLTPSQFVDRYLRITDAMRRVDPSIKVGPCPNNPWGPLAAIENEHLIQLLAHPDAPIDLLYHHYYYVWVGDYFRPTDVNRNLRALKNFGYLLNSQYASQFARAGRPMVPTLISEWNPDWSIHPPVERNMLSALATAEVFFTFAELRVLGAHYWENPDGRASSFVFERLKTHLGDRFLGSSAGTPADDGRYAGFGLHPSAASDVRIYATQRSADSRVFVWMINLSDTVTHTVEWQHPRPVVLAQTQTLQDPARATTYYTPVSQMRWVPGPPLAEQPSTRLAPATLTILELTYQQDLAPSPPPPVIASVSRAFGAANSEVRITGTGFAESPADNVVYFGKGRATVVESSPTNLKVLVPSAATYGPITVTALGRSAVSRDFFSLGTRSNGNPPIPPESLALLPQPLYAPEGAPIVTAPVDLMLLDWQGTGRLQLAGLTWRSGSILPHTIDLFPNDSTPGQPSFSTPICDPQLSVCSLTLNSSPAKFASADLDGDGHIDLACVERHAWQVAAWRNALPAPDRSFDVMGLYPTSRSPSFLAIQDIDTDGRPDFVVTSAADNTLGVMRNLSPGPGVFAFSTNWLFRAAHPADMVGPHTLAIGDLVGDARPDVVVASRSATTLSVFRNESQPGHPQLVALPGIPGDRVESMTLGDVDGDGRLDIIASGQWPNGGIFIWRNNDADGFERLTFPTSRDPRQLCLADLNGDGRPEIITVNNDTVSLSVFRNLSEPGTVSLDTRQDFPIDGLLPNDPICLTAGDMDGDGRADIAVGNYYSGFISLLHNRTIP